MKTLTSRIVYVMIGCVFGSCLRGGSV